jgi:ABC-type bacteriocin/lantibiotic exporter with double-glycine peptidase domain
LIKKIFSLLDAKEKRRAFILFGMIVVMAFFDALGVASIMPFMAVLSNFNLVESNYYLSFLYTHLHFSETRFFLIFLGFMVLTFLVVSLAFKAITIWFLLTFTHTMEYSLIMKLMRGNLGQPYEFFLTKNSSSFSKSMLGEVDLLVGGVVMPLLYIFAHSVVAFFLLSLLLIVNFKLAIIVVFILLFAYISFHFLFRVKIKRIGSERVIANKIRFLTISEAFGGIKEIKVAGLEDFFINKLDAAARKFSSNQIIFQLVAQIPRYIIEIIAFGGLSLMVILLIAESGSFSNAMPVISLYAYAAYKIMPAIQQIYSYTTQLRFSKPVLDALYSELNSLEFILPKKSRKILTFNNSICFDNVSFSYLKECRASINNISFELPAKGTIAFVGSSGSGKSTILDLLLGVLTPSSGRFLVDSQEISRDNLSAWQRNIGYVPQHIYISDGTIMENIAFGIDDDDVDLKAIRRAAEISQIADFINQLPLGYQTKVGERGIRLSGGQRQRLGLARALYRSPKILILDEATSALDNLTEKHVMNSIYDLSKILLLFLLRIDYQV